MRRKIKRKLKKMFSSHREGNSTTSKSDAQKPNQILNPRFNIPFSPKTLTRK